MPVAFLALLATACTPQLYSPVDTAEAEDWSWEAPENGWTTNAPPEGLVGEGWAEGDVVPDFLLMDQHGDMVSLWQFYGTVIVLDHSTYWCAVCQTLAQDVDETWLEYEDQGFMYLSLLSQDLEGDVPGIDVLQEWAEYFDITAPILSDDAGIADIVVGSAEGFPRLQLIDREMHMVVDQINPTTDAQIREEIEAIL